MSKTYSFRSNNELSDQIERICEREGVSKSEFVRECVQKRVNHILMDSASSQYEANSNLLNRIEKIKRETEKQNEYMSDIVEFLNENVGEDDGIDDINKLVLSQMSILFEISDISREELEDKMRTSHMNIKSGDRSRIPISTKSSSSDDESGGGSDGTGSLMDDGINPLE